MSVLPSTESTVSMTSVNEDTILSFGKPSQIASTVCPSLPSSTRKYFACMEVRKRDVYVCEVVRKRRDCFRWSNISFVGRTQSRLENNGTNTKNCKAYGCGFDLQSTSSGWRWLWIFCEKTTRHSVQRTKLLRWVWQRWCLNERGWNTHVLFSSSQTCRIVEKKKQKTSTNIQQQKTKTQKNRENNQKAKKKKRTERKDE